MIATTEQFDSWLRDRGITDLLFTGFATNLCILDSPAAMKAMRALGYRCVIIREGTLGVEFPDTLETLEMLKIPRTDAKGRPLPPGSQEPNSRD